MKPADLQNNKKPGPIWIIISAIPLQIGSIIAMLWILSSDNKNKAYALLYLIPFIGPIIAYVLMGKKDKYVSTMAEWVFVGQILGYVVWYLLFISHIV